jgi:hypothetical protein
VGLFFGVVFVGLWLWVCGCGFVVVVFFVGLFWGIYLIYLCLWVCCFLCSELLPPTARGPDPERREGEEKEKRGGKGGEERGEGEAGWSRGCFCGFVVVGLWLWVCGCGFVVVGLCVFFFQMSELYLKRLQRVGIRFFFLDTSTRVRTADLLHVKQT